MDLAKLADFLNAKGLMGRPFCDYSEDEIMALVVFIIENFASRQPCPIMVDHAQRLIVPVNADKRQLKVAIRWIQAMIDWSGEPVEPMTEVKDAEHAWDAYRERGRTD